MHVVTHLLAGWCAGSATRMRGRDLTLVALAGAAPDLDGIGLVVDVATKRLGMAETDFYAWHHVYGHGLPAAIAIALVVAAFAVRRRPAALAALLAVHLHLLGDVLGSRGSRPEDIWEISYLMPLSDAWRIVWAGQWPVTGWQNTVITTVLFALALVLAVRNGESPVAMLSKRADAAVVATLRARFSRQPVPPAAPPAAR